MEVVKIDMNKYLLICIAGLVNASDINDNVKVKAIGNIINNVTTITRVDQHDIKWNSSMGGFF